MNATADDWLYRPLIGPANPTPTMQSAAAALAPAATELRTPPPDYQRMARDWALLALVAILAWNWITRDRDTDPSPTPHVAGLRVLILEESADRARLTPQQSAIFNAVSIREAIQKREGQLLVLDRNDDVSRLTQDWQTLRQRSTLPTPSVVFANARRAVEMPLPGSVNEFLSKLEGFK